MDIPGGSNIESWVQVGGVIGAVVVGALLMIRGRLGEASAAISQTRAEATEVFVRETQANRDALNALSVIMSRQVSVQEDMLKMMQEQREDERFVTRTTRLLEKIAERDRNRGHTPPGE